MQTTYSQHQALTSPVTETPNTRVELDSNPNTEYDGSLRQDDEQPVRLRYESDISKSWYFPRRTASLRKHRATRAVSTGSFEPYTLSDHHLSNGPHPTSPESTTFWPDRNIQEAYLMRYFVEELAQWFDSCDLARHFALVAPYRAPSCPALLYAIFSVSARHLTGDATEVQDENLLAAAVILRFYEELDAPLIGVDDETYLRGTQVFLEAQSEMAVKGHGLQTAAFWVGFRQEFHTAFIKQRAFRFDLTCCNYSPYRTLGPADDFTWANRVVLHCAETLLYCYGDEAHDLDRYGQLWEYSQNWYAYKPQTFNPIYLKAPNRSQKEIFPQIWYLGDCQVTAVQHWHLARILLAAFDPKMPRIGPNQKRAAANREAEIKTNLFRLCGIALSNKTAPGLITACMGVSMCGDRFTERLEREALLDILIKTEEIHALSTGKAQRELREAWN
ncbi:uncharacterized protein N7446_005583 [Penicillium canescens]|uniref:Uncharacterized protein n=1 Tax=Penicillium canescens TaxID=5083 RepID=A0AAD6NBE8_PENCN|nr:uncharacterized protein N7446_005583 [Penicillium canescens]KAJ6050955.1 hypothetical protein N7460_001489 [Penicillium canescens]KAJ6061463.1 hypothetical protein N7446_005583 [Penicillium canescens]